MQEVNVFADDTSGILAPNASGQNGFVMPQTCSTNLGFGLGLRGTAAIVRVPTSLRPAGGAEGAPRRRRRLFVCFRVRLFVIVDNWAVRNYFWTYGAMPIKDNQLLL